MDIEYIVKIKGKNVPEFIKGLGRGVLYKVIVSYKGVTEKNVPPLTAVHIIEQGDKFLKEVVDVSYKIIKKKKKSKN